jgi:hypothetical protein
MQWQSRGNLVFYSDGVQSHEIGQSLPSLSVYVQNGQSGSPTFIGTLDNVEVAGSIVRNARESFVPFTETQTGRQIARGVLVRTEDESHVTMRLYIRDNPKPIAVRVVQSEIGQGLIKQISKVVSQFDLGLRQRYWTPNITTSD